MSKKSAMEIGGGVFLQLADDASPRQALDYASAILDSLGGALGELAAASPFPDRSGLQPEKILWSLSHLADVALAALEVGSAEVVSVVARQGGRK